MCGESLLIPAIASAVSTAASAGAGMMQHNAEQHAANKQFALEAHRQNQLDQQRQQAFHNILQHTAGKENVQNAMDHADQQRAQAIEENTTRAPGSHSLTNTGTNPATAGQSGTHVVDQAYAGRSAHDTGQTDARGKALASISSLGDALQNLQEQRQPQLDTMQASNNAARQSASLLPSEINNATNRASTTGSLLGAAGQLGSGLSNAALGHYAAQGSTLLPHSVGNVAGSSAAKVRGYA